jgi:hypothetical protein
MMMTQPISNSTVVIVVLIFFLEIHSTHLTVHICTLQCSSFNIKPQNNEESIGAYMQTVGQRLLLITNLTLQVLYC